MTQENKCPEKSALVEYLLGTFPESDVEILELHVGQCPSCEDTLLTLENSSDTVMEAIRNHPQEEIAALAAVPELRRAIQRLQALGGGEAADESKPSSNRQADKTAYPDNFGPYRLGEQLGRGGMGIVFRGFHQRLGKPVAIKIVAGGQLQHPNIVARFEREMRAVGAMDHPNLVRAHDAGETDDGRFLFLAMELIDGVDVGNIVKHCGPFAVADACEIVRQAAQGLEYVHQQGQIHRDIKPSNLMVNRQGTVKILDLGLSRLHEALDGATRTGLVMGTPDYMSPEQATDSHQVDARADIYSLGCALYELLSGRPPFGDQTTSPIDKILAHKGAIVPSLSEQRAGIPAPLADLVQRMLAKSPDQRPASAQQVAEELESFASGADLSQFGGDNDNAFVETTSQIEQTTALPRPAPSRKQTPPISPTAARWPGMQRGLIYGTSAVIVITLLALAAMFVFRTPNGTVEIRLAEGVDENIQVVASQGGNQIEVADKENGWKIEIREGQYTFELKGATDKFRLEKETLTVERKKKEVLRVIVRQAAGKRLPQKQPSVIGSTEDHKSSQPLYPGALVTQPAEIKGMKSWTLETVGQRGAVRDLCFSPDGKVLATGGDDGVIRLLDPQSGKLLQVLYGHQAAVRCLAWSHNGKYLASGSFDHTAKIWDPIAAKVLQEIPNFKSPIRFVRWSPTEEKCLALSFEGRLQIWNVNKKRGLVVSSVHIRDIIWSSDGSQIAANGRFDGKENQIKRWDATTAKPLEVVEVSQDKNLRVERLAWTSEGGLIAVGRSNPGHGNAVVWSWDLKRGIPKEPIEIKEKTIRHGSLARLSLSPDEKSLMGVYAIDDHASDLWHFSKDLSTSKTTRMPTCQALAWSPDGKSFVTAHTQVLTQRNISFIKYWNLQGLSQRLIHEGHPRFTRAVSFSPSGKSIASGFPGGRLCLLPAKSADRPRFVEQLSLWKNKQIPELTWLSKPERILAISYHDYVTSWSVNDLKDTVAWNHWGAVQLAIAGVPNQESVLASGDFNSLELCDSKTGEIQFKIPNSWGAYSCLSFNADGTALAAANGNTLATWRKTPEDKWEEVGERIKPGNVREIAWSHDSKQLLCTYEDDTVRIWNIETRGLVQSWQGGLTAPRWDENQKQVWAVGKQGNLSTWNIDTGKRVATYPLAGGDVAQADWSPDGRLLVVAGDNNVMRLYDGQTGKLHYTTVVLDPEKYQDSGLQINASGHYRGASNAWQELRYVAITQAGKQLILTPDEFEEQYRWKNDPSKVKLEK